jgi:hypothetical protein
MQEKGKGRGKEAEAEGKAEGKAEGRGKEVQHHTHLANSSPSPILLCEM